MQLPPHLLNSLEGTKGFDKEAFVKVHDQQAPLTSVRINPFKNDELSIHRHSSFAILQKVPWTEYGYYLRDRPSFTFDPLFHAGCYYVQEASSMFLEQALKQTIDLSMPVRVLDLCAAPGGKSTHILSLISKDSLLVSNEVIRLRANILKVNMAKWGCSNVVVTNHDPKDFQQLDNYFDVIIVDAPCSGSGLFRREPEAIEEWSAENVMLCSRRQQRILADVLPALKKGGVLIYSTCSYSAEEDEQIAEWLRNEFNVHEENLSIDPGWNIVKSSRGYRFWPDKIKGEGFFIACFTKKNGDGKEARLPKVKPEKFSKREWEVLSGYLDPDGMSFIRQGKILRAIPENLLPEMNLISSKLHQVSCGTQIGELIREKLVPEQGLAMSTILSDEVMRIELGYDQAIQYLQKKELNLATEIKGWSLVTFKDHPLGWINILSNRINNYYPKELRILKDQNT